MKLNRLLLAATLAFAGTASATVISFTDAYGPAATNWTHSLAISQFDDSLGTLNSVSFWMDGYISQSVKAENTGDTADILSPVISASMLYRQGTTTQNILLITGSAPVFSASAFDGVSDYMGPSGHDFGTINASGSLFFTITGPSLVDYIGSGTLSAFNIRTIGTGSVDTDNGNLDASIKTTARYGLTVAYDYTAPVPDTPTIPEPGTLALLGIGLLGLGVNSKYLSKRQA